MERIVLDPRPNWQSEVEHWGLLFHTEESGAYWDESACYRFTEAEVLDLEASTQELHRLCLEAVDSVIAKRQLDRFGIPEAAWERIEWSWHQRQPSLYGRFDLAFDGTGPAKMLEYNADTPTALLEAAVVQWKWLEARYPSADQFNSIWEGLVEHWGDLRDDRLLRGTKVTFAHADTLEDRMTIALLRDTAHEAGLTTNQILVEDIGFDHDHGWFVDLDDRRMWSIFKLYPWEWMMREEFGPAALQSMDETQWFEPIWKMILSNKVILAVLWELFPGHRNLLPAFLDGPNGMTHYVKKAILGREGANVSIVTPSGDESSDGPYGEEGFVYQGLAPLRDFDGKTPILGSWIVGDLPRGVGVREANGRITTNTSRFVPHYFE